MNARPRICFTFVGDATRDSRLRRCALAAASRAEVFILQLARDMHTPGNEASIGSASAEISSGPSNEQAADMQTPWGKTGEGHIHLMHYPMRGSLRSALPRFWRQAALAAREIDGDLFVASDLFSLPAAARAAKRARKPLLYDARELYCSVAALQGRRLMQRFWNWVEKRYARRAAVVLTVNDSIATILRETYSDVRVVRNVSDFPKPAPSRKIRDLLGIPENRRILLSQGGLQQGRGAFILVDILMELPDCHLVFLGDGALRGDIEAAARIAGVSERVCVLPSVPSGELPAWTASADLGMCLIEDLGRSYYLSLPNKLFEYIAAGVPVIGSDFPEIGPLLRETSSGIAVNPSEPELVLRAIRTLLNDDGRYERSRQACLEAATQYHWDVEREHYLHILDGLLPQKTE